MSIQHPKSVEESPLFQEINKTIKESSAHILGIHVSMTTKGEWYTHEGEEYWVKWLCWNLFGKAGHDITKPKLCVVNGDLNQQEFEANFSSFFSAFNCLVDNDITME